MFNEANTVEQIPLGTYLTLRGPYDTASLLLGQPVHVLAELVLSGLRMQLNLEFAAQPPRRLQRGGGG